MAHASVKDQRHLTRDSLGRRQQLARFSDEVAQRLAAVVRERLAL